MQACVQNALALRDDAEALRREDRHTRAFALYHCACEELGKFYMLEIVGRKLQNGIPVNWKRFWKRFRSHDSKMAQCLARSAAFSAYAADPESKLKSDAGALSWFLLSIKPRNSSLYVEISANGMVESPNAAEWGPRTELLSSLVDLLLAASLDVGHDEGTILSRFDGPSFSDGDRAIMRMLALQYLFTDMSAEEAHEQIDRLWGERPPP